MKREVYIKNSDEHRIALHNDDQAPAAAIADLQPEPVTGCNDQTSYAASQMIFELRSCAEGHSVGREFELMIRAAGMIERIVFGEAITND